MRSTRGVSDMGIPFKNSDGMNPSICNNVVVVILDASKAWSGSSQAAVSWTIDKIVQTGDWMILLGMLDSSANQRRLSGFLGSMSKSGLDFPNKARDDEVMKKKSEMESNTASSRTICYQKGIKFDVEVRKGPPKLIAIQVAMSLRATWVILNRNLKKEAKFFFDQLSCGLIRMKQNHEGDILRVPKTFGDSALQGGLMEDNHYHRDDISERINDSSLFNQFHAKREFVKDHFGSVASHVNCAREDTEVDIDNKKLKNIPNDASVDPDLKIRELKGYPIEQMASNCSDSMDYGGLSSFSTTSRNSQASSSAPLSASSMAFDASVQRPYEEKFRPNKGGQLDEQDYNNVSTTTQLENGDMAIESSSESKSDMGGSDLEYSTESSQAHERSYSLSNDTLLYTRHTSGYSLLCSICKQASPVFSEKPKRFTLSELKEATGNFSRDNFIAEGGFGLVFRGVFEGGKVVAVKRHKLASAQADLEFCSEVELLSYAQHSNLIMLLGYCDENGQRCLVYEYVCNGSLHWHLSSRNPKPLEWWSRYKIAVGTARALRYLHEECRIGCIIHRDMRPTNILLTHDFKPLVGDFGLARFQPDLDESIYTRLIGAFGYLAPEYAETGQVSWKTDVYSFGVVLLELISGLKAIDMSRAPEENSLAEFARIRIDNGRYYELVDHRLQGLWDESQMRCVVRAASFCIRRDPSTRPKMSEVVHVLEGGEIRDSIESIDSPTVGTSSSGDLFSSQQMPSLGSTTTNKLKPFMSRKNPRMRLSYGDM